MEPARYWMWTKRKHELISHGLSSAKASSFGDSWEEQAFAEDAAGALGGCVWPPRSYTCTFCRREFRSAQALGGHMNVHRRDRARLKQCPSPQSEAFPHNNNNNNILNPCNPLENPLENHHYEPQICNFLYNPSSETDHKVVLASPSSPVRVTSQPITKATSDAKTTFASCFFPIVEEQRSKNVLPSFPPWSNLAAEKYMHGSTDMIKKEEKKKSEMVDSNSRDHQGQPVKAGLPVSLNLVICRNPSSVSDDAEEAVASCKRRRIVDHQTPLTFFPKQNSVDRFQASSDMPELMNPSFRDHDIDLELRLGEPPKVK